MHYVRLLLYYLSLTSIGFLLLGLWKPWIMLWWEDTQNRGKVIQVYGTLAGIFYLAYWILSFYEK
jgi:hypothetical protein